MPKTNLDWRDKWQAIQSKFDTAVSECITAYRSDGKCRDSLEAVIADVWNLKDWLQRDPTVAVPREEMHNFLASPEAFHIRGCGDVETLQKHFEADDPRREEAHLILEANHNHPSGYPVVFRARRVYRPELDAPPTAPVSSDEWEDAVEMAHRAIKQWRVFLEQRGLL